MQILKGIWINKNQQVLLGFYTPAYEKYNSTDLADDQKKLSNI